jgi:hypothetical protein
MRTVEAGHRGRKVNLENIEISCSIESGILWVKVDGASSSTGYGTPYHHTRRMFYNRTGVACTISLIRRTTNMGIRCVELEHLSFVLK